jgi:uncharacterized protein (DUF1501 family)
MKRRNFLRKTLPATMLPFFINAIPTDAFGRLLKENAISSSESDTDRILVLVQLIGGNDGLNTVVPIDQYANLTKARGNIMIAENKLLPLNNTSITGFHPAMADLQNLYNNKEVTVIQGVGYPNPNYSHFRATDIWLTGSDSNSVLDTGWAGRFLSQEFPNYPVGYPNSNAPDPPAIQIGSFLSTVFQGPTVGLGETVGDISSFYDIVLGPYESESNTPAGHELDFIRLTAKETKQYTGAIKAASLAQKNLSSKYQSLNNNSLADQLKIVAQLIGGGLKTRIYMVTLDGFDTHGEQVDPSDTSQGRQARLLSRLSEAIMAFQDDLNLMGKQKKVLGMVFSEFGRRIKSNASMGTDHGSTGPIILFGPQLKGGLIGKNPVISDNIGVNDNLSLQHDFRSVYASILRGWFNMSTEELKKVLPDDYPILDLFK